MNKTQKSKLARKFGSKTGKFKKKHLYKAKNALENRKVYNTDGTYTLNLCPLTEGEINKLLGETNE